MLILINELMMVVFKIWKVSFMLRMEDICVVLLASEVIKISVGLFHSLLYMSSKIGIISIGEFYM